MFLESRARIKGKVLSFRHRSATRMCNSCMEHGKLKARQIVLYIEHFLIGAGTARREKHKHLCYTFRKRPSNRRRLTLKEKAEILLYKLGGS